MLELAYFQKGLSQIEMANRRSQPLGTVKTLGPNGLHRLLRQELGVRAPRSQINGITQPSTDHERAVSPLQAHRSELSKRRSLKILAAINTRLAHLETEMDGLNAKLRKISGCARPLTRSASGELHDR